MIAVAVSLLPALGVLLYAMDRIEDRLSARSSAPRHARRRHLRLVRGAAPDGGPGSGPHGGPHDTSTRRDAVGAVIGRLLPRTVVVARGRPTDVRIGRVSGGTRAA
ncbi:hypothetical protein IOD14_16735 [Streptomyces sp. A2-16]|uniref:hypothetical protein n=1 Tax=Streptomyces sp. A2-16 TaxID=2781734 RepID=UPI001BB03952|nr:hypothetical protein [Streptomyces sp. A2-16]QUC58320.1 hypothetical protein IOD14_16735 [Streptomyces sp. A2-16]